MARFDKLTLKATEALQAAQEIAAGRHHQNIEVEHLLLALLEQTDGVVLPLLKKLGVDPGRVKGDIEEALSRMPKVEGLVQTYLSPRLGKLFERAEQEADRLKDEYVSTEHLLIAAADGDGAGREVLARHGITKDRIFTVLVDIRGSQRVTDQNPEDKYQALTRYGRDLTDLARQGKAIMMISSELPEILRMSHRIIVMCEGRITGELNSGEATQEKIMYCATQRTALAGTNLSLSAVPELEKG